MIPVVNGFLMAHRARGGPPMVGGTSLGEGGTSTGAFHEALNQAAIEKLPLVLVVANNQYAYSAPVTRQFACAHLVDRAVGYGVAGRTVDGTDLGACLAVVGEAVAAARAGGGPQLVVGSLLRLCGHGEHDAAAYIDPELKRSPIGRDCLKVAESHLVQQGWADAAQVAAWREKVVREVDQVVTTVQREPGPDPYKEHWCALASKHLSEGFADV
jgi:pyruvate dehydrogenase E1 component alpha subunit/2-oxoisovalerate dehydrogenase E1 component alpha subunit